MKIFTLGAALLLSASTLTAAPKVGMLIGYPSSDNENAQESTAAKWFEATYPDGVILTPSDLDKIDAAELAAIWVHIDRLGIGMGYDNLPAEFKDAKDALKKYVEAGGSLYLSKFATQMVHELGRIDADKAPGIFGDGDGGIGTDDWCLNAYLGSMQENGITTDPDPTQVYDRTSHPIYAGMEKWDAHSERIADYPHPAYPMLGTGTGDEIHREDHNCMWDLNAYTWTADGKNTLEKFEKQYDCTVLGTWGHVQDYCVAGIVEFNPAAEGQGTIIANGLAACEWAPRTANNAFHSNLTKLTENTLNYLASKSASTGINSVETALNGEETFYTLQGVKVANPTQGIFIKISNGKAHKVILK